MVLNALSCDLEDYFQVQACEGLVAQEAWTVMAPRLVESTETVLSLLEEAGVKATFFVLGWNAERHPELVRRIAAAGHEVASHGHAHRMVTAQSPEEFRADVTRSKAVLEDLAGHPVLGYRAPTFSITSRTLWALGILAEAGYRYDSSIFPIRHDRYGIPHARRFIHRLDGEGRAAEGSHAEAAEVRREQRGAEAGSKSEIVGRKSRMSEGCGPESASPHGLVEFPPTTLRVLGCNVPVAGGGYLRLLPARLVLAALRRVNRQGQPAMVYFHPWELDPGQPRLPLRGVARFRHYVGLRRTADKLRLLLRCLAFTTAAAVVEEWAARKGCVAREP